MSEDIGDEFYGSVFNLDGVHHSQSWNAGILTPAVKAPVRIEDLKFLMEVETELQHPSCVMQITNGISNALL